MIGSKSVRNKQKQKSSLSTHARWKSCFMVKEGRNVGPDFKRLNSMRVLFLRERDSLLTHFVMSIVLKYHLVSHSSQTNL